MPRSIEQLVNQQVMKWIEDQARVSEDRVPPSRVREL